jgi:hypothetical protein
MSTFTLEQLFTAETAEYARTLQVAGFTVYGPTNPRMRVDGLPVPSGWFHYSRTVDGRECYGTFHDGSDKTFGTPDHSMPITPSRLNGSSAHIGGRWGDAATLNIDNMDPLSVAYAEAVARPANWCPFNAEATPEAVTRANSGQSVPQRFYQGAALANARPWGIGTTYVPLDA